MLEKTFIDICSRNSIDMDIIPYFCGYEECPQGYQFGPLIRQQFILHYIVEGRCNFQEEAGNYYLGSNQGFIIYPNTPIFFKAYAKEPLKHYWIGFGGKKAEYYLDKLGFSPQKPIYTFDTDASLLEAFIAMHCISVPQKDSEMELLALFYKILHLLMSSTRKADEEIRKRNKEFYIHKAIELIAASYFTKTSIEHIAKKMNISKKYLSQVLKDYYGVSTQKLLTDFRIVKAGELLCNPDMKISDIARSVGYDDPLHFSKVFKKKKGISPEQYRKNVQEGIEV